MSEIKNPFLSDTEDPDNNTKKDSLEYSSAINTHREESQYDDELRDEIEIKDDGKLLRNIIIILIVLLLLALLGLGLYSFLNKKNNPTSNSNIQNIENVNISDFEMKGTEFKASSIVVEK